MIKINFSNYKIQARSIKSALKKLDLEDMYNDKNEYKLDDAKAIIEYLYSNGSDSIKKGIESLIADVKAKKEEIQALKEKQEAQRLTADHTVKNKSFEVKQEVITIVNEAISKDKITQEYSINTGFSSIVKYYALKHALAIRKENKRIKLEDSINKVLKMYKNIVTHMNSEKLNFDTIRQRYIMKESIQICDIIKEVLDIESKGE